MKSAAAASSGYDNTTQHEGRGNEGGCSCLCKWDAMNSRYYCCYCSSRRRSSCHAQLPSGDWLPIWKCSIGEGDLGSRSAWRPIGDQVTVTMIVLSSSSRLSLNYWHHCWWSWTKWGQLVSTPRHVVQASSHLEQFSDDDDDNDDTSTTTTTITHCPGSSSALR